MNLTFTCSKGHDQRNIEQGTIAAVLRTWGDQDSHEYLNHTLEQISGDDKDGIFEYTITIPTTALPDIETRNTLWDQKYAKKWQIRLGIEDNAGHEQAFLLYDWSDVNNGFSITNDKFEHELPQFTYSLDKALLMLLMKAKI